MMKRTISIFLILSFVLSISSVAFAAETNDSFALAEKSQVFDNSTWETIYVTLDDGRVVPVEVSIETECHENIASPAMTPVVPVGTIKSVSLRVSNDALGLAGSAGERLTSQQKKTVAQVSSKAANTKAGMIIATTAGILSYLSTANYVIGNNGFAIIYKAKYVSRYISSQGHYTYNWQPHYFYMGTY